MNVWPFFFETEIGPMAMVMVGAAIVGAIGTSWHGDVKRTKRKVTFNYTYKSPEKYLAQGEEMGFFKLGSTVVLLFANGQELQWESSLQAGAGVRFGQAIAAISKDNGCEEDSNPTEQIEIKHS